MRKLRTRIALLIALLILAALLPTGIVASAEEGTCGENLTWAMDDDGALIISGTGETHRQDLTPALTNADDSAIL
ncbi:MAG: hypothetical protein IKZ81_07025, partial [Clostridia bacterium]|nr:hypothetical protein [Clostridia bacterium]